MKVFLMTCGFLLMVSSVRANSDSLIVYVFLLEKCQICSASVPEIKRLHQQFQDQGVVFKGIFPNAAISNEESMDSFALVHELPFSVQLDVHQELTREMEATVTPEVILMNKGEILYRGKIDNMYERVGKRRQVVTQFYLEEALHSALNKEHIAIQFTEPVGCFIMKNTTIKTSNE